MNPFQAGPPLSPDQRRSILNNAVMRQISLGWRVEAQFDTQAALVTAGRVNHLLHAILTAVTCGTWLPVWIILAISGAEKHVTITVDENGVVLINGRPAPLPGPVAGPPPPAMDGNAQAVAAAHARRELRRRAREQAKDVALARELCIGRPDLPRHYDDGGLIDINHVAPPALTMLTGVTPEIAERIVAIREQVGGFSSAEELAATADLHPDLLPEINEYGIFLP
jgi:hypothetical protein